VEALADRLGVSTRHQHRLFIRHLGAPPVAVAQTRRLHFAKQLISDTDLPMAQVALASGFQSVRRFNDVFRKLYGRAPSALRRLSQVRGSSKDGEYVLRLAYRPPYDWPSMLLFLASHADAATEEITEDRYRRRITVAGQRGTLEVQAAAANALEARINFPEPAGLLQVVTQVRSVFDLAADPETIRQHLDLDSLVAPHLGRFPGLRVPNRWDGSELTVPEILGPLPRAAELGGHVDCWRPWHTYGAMYLWRASMVSR
jgi:AraC family transcriptional regulator of adaptative response / DNA-3-methyladenine glycosylase II